MNSDYVRVPRLASDNGTLLMESPFDDYWFEMFSSHDISLDEAERRLSRIRQSNDANNIGLSQIPSLIDSDSVVPEPEPVLEGARFSTIAFPTNNGPQSIARLLGAIANELTITRNVFEEGFSIEDIKNTSFGGAFDDSDPDKLVETIKLADERNGFLQAIKTRDDSGDPLPEEKVVYALTLSGLRATAEFTEEAIAVSETDMKLVATDVTNKALIALDDPHAFENDRSDFQMLKADYSMPNISKFEGQESGFIEMGGSNIYYGKAKVVREGDSYKVEYSNRVKKPWPAGMRQKSGMDKFRWLLNEAKDLDVPVLGIVFSFPIENGIIQDAANGDKGFNWSDLVGKDAKEVLNELIASEGIMDSKVTAIVNDTESVLVRGHAISPQFKMGSVHATGINTAIFTGGSIYNVETEWYQIPDSVLNPYYKEVYANAETVLGGGNYGEIGRIILESYIERGLLFRDRLTPEAKKIFLEGPDENDESKGLHAKYVDALALNDPADNIAVLEKLGITNPTQNEAEIVQLLLRPHMVNVRKITAAIHHGLALAIKENDTDEVTEVRELVDGTFAISANYELGLQSELNVLSQPNEMEVGAHVSQTATQEGIPLIALQLAASRLGNEANRFDNRDHEEDAANLTANLFLQFLNETPINALGARMMGVDVYWLNFLNLFYPFAKIITHYGIMSVAVSIYVLAMIANTIAVMMTWSFDDPRIKNLGGLMLTNHEVHKSLRTYALPEKKKVAVLELSPGDIVYFSEEFMDAIHDPSSQNDIQYYDLSHIKNFDEVDLEDILGKFRPELVIPPYDGFHDDSPIEKMIRRYVKKNKIELDGLHYESPQIKSPANTYISFTLKDLLVAMKNILFHKTQMRTTDYQQMLKLMASYAGKVAKINGFIPRFGPAFANAFTVREFIDGELKEINGAVEHKLSELVPLLVGEPHPDDGVLAAFGLIIKMFKRFKGEGPAVINVVRGSGIYGVQDLTRDEILWGIEQLKELFRPGEFLYERVKESNGTFRPIIDEWKERFRSEMSDEYKEAIQILEAYQDIDLLESQIQTWNERIAGDISGVDLVEEVDYELQMLIKRIIRKKEVIEEVVGNAKHYSGKYTGAAAHVEWLDLDTGLFPPNIPERPSPEMIEADTQRMKKFFEAFYEKHEANILQDQANGIPWNVVSTDILDGHPHHNSFTLIVRGALSAISKEKPSLRIRPYDYFAPWAGNWNAFFASNSKKSSRKVKYHGSANINIDWRQIAASREFKELMSLIAAQLAAQFGKVAPTPQELGGNQTERFFRVHYSWKDEDTELDAAASRMATLKKSIGPTSQSRVLHEDFSETPLVEWDDSQLTAISTSFVPRLDDASDVVVGSFEASVVHSRHLLDSEVPWVAQTSDNNSYSVIIGAGEDSNTVYSAGENNIAYEFTVNTENQGVQPFSDSLSTALDVKKFDVSVDLQSLNESNIHPKRDTRAAFKLLSASPVDKSIPVGQVIPLERIVNHLAADGIKRDKFIQIVRSMVTLMRDPDIGNNFFRFEGNDFGIGQDVFPDQSTGFRESHILDIDEVNWKEGVGGYFYDSSQTGDYLDLVSILIFNSIVARINVDDASDFVRMRDDLEQIVYRATGKKINFNLSTVELFQNLRNTEEALRVYRAYAIPFIKNFLSSYLDDVLVTIKSSEIST